MSIEVKAQNTLSMTSVKAIKDATDEANSLLDSMRQSAEDAGTTLNGIYQNAMDAQASANSAQASADSASEYASRAYANLSTLQSLTETLDWITQHGTMTLTSDTTLDPTHVYFVRDNSGDYVVGGQHYAVVSEPDVADISTYYELSINESLNNYVATHLAVDSEGLWIIPDAGGNKVLIATGSGSTYTTAGTYIIGKANGVDTIFAKFTTNGATMNATDSVQIAHLGYGEGQSDGATDNAPYYSFGSRKTTSTSYSPSRTYSIGEMRVYNGKLYCCITPIETPEAWNSSHWQLAIGNYSVAEGNDSVASGKFAHAEGSSTKAIGLASHAEGGSRMASGRYAHSEGANTEANGISSHAQNDSTIANGHYQTTLGRYNIADTTSAVIIGNGTANNARSNALTIDWDGNITINNEPMADFVVAQSSQAETSIGTGTWRWREWNSGKVEIWYNGTITLNTKSSTSGLYRNVRRITFPNGYALYKCICIINGTVGGGWLNCGGLFNSSQVHAEPYTIAEVMAYQINTYPADNQTNVNLYICGELNA